MQDKPWNPNPIYFHNQSRNQSNRHGVASQTHITDDSQI